MRKCVALRTPGSELKKYDLRVLWNVVWTIDTHTLSYVCQRDKNYIGQTLDNFCFVISKFSLTHFWPRIQKKRAGLDGNNGKSAERTVAKSTNRSRNGSDLCVRQPTDQKAGGSNPSRRTKSPRNRLISRTFAFHKFRFFGAAFFWPKRWPQRDSGKDYTAVFKE